MAAFGLQMLFFFAITFATLDLGDTHLLYGTMVVMCVSLGFQTRVMKQHQDVTVTHDQSPAGTERAVMFHGRMLYFPCVGSIMTSFVFLTAGFAMVHYYRDTCPPEADQQCCEVYCGSYGDCIGGRCECSSGFTGDRCENAPAYEISGALHGSLDLNGLYIQLPSVASGTNDAQKCSGRPVYQKQNWQGTDSAPILFQPYYPPPEAKNWDLQTSDRKCVRWAEHGECDKNVGFMRVQCLAACRRLHARRTKVHWMVGSTTRLHDCQPIGWITSAVGLVTKHGSCRWSPDRSGCVGEWREWPRGIASSRAQIAGANANESGWIHNSGVIFSATTVTFKGNSSMPTEAVTLNNGECPASLWLAYKAMNSTGSVTLTIVSWLWLLIQVRRCTCITVDCSGSAHTLLPLFYCVVLVLGVGR